MDIGSTYQRLKEAVSVIKSRSSVRPKVGFILGSGLGKIADEMPHRDIIEYKDIPFFHGTTVEGHAGRMVLGDFEGVPSVFLQGRFHFYEGYPMQEVVFPTRTICALGIETLVLTNAAGGVNTRFRVCDIMLIEDHLNLMGDNPLKGPNLSELGPRFPDMTEAYSRELIALAEKAGKELAIPLQRGVYCGLVGPTYETPAEIRMIRTLGADSVGMSTVPECIAANHLGVRVLGLSCITNLAAGMSEHKLSHDEVFQNSDKIVGKLSAILRRITPQLISQKNPPA